MKLCIVGNSHVGMIVAAIAARNDTQTDLTIFARPSMIHSDIAVEGTTLIASSDELIHRLKAHDTPTEVDLSQFDAVLFVGMTASVFSAAQVIGYHSVHGWPATAKLLEAPGPTYRQIISLSALQWTLRANIAESQTGRLCKALEPCGIGPIFVVPQPYPAMRILTVQRRYPIIKRLHRDQEGILLAQELEHWHHDFFDPMKGIFYLQQEPDTIEAGFLTRTAFTRNAVRLNIERKHKKNDVLHTNGKFGQRVLERIDAQLRV